MTAAELLTRARTAGLAVTVSGDRLLVRGPRSAQGLAKKLLAHKPELVAILTGRIEQPAGRGWIDYERHSCPLCNTEHDSCQFTAGSLYCAAEDCRNPHHRSNR